MNYQIVKVTKENYQWFDDMIYFRLNNVERKNDQNQTNIKDLQVDNLKELENSNLHLYAATVNEKMIGWISLIYLPKVGKYKGRGIIYIDELWVEKGHRNKGIGKALLMKADELSSNLNASSIRLFVDSSNQIAQKLYNSCKFRVVSNNLMMEKNKTNTQD